MKRHNFKKILLAGLSLGLSACGGGSGGGAALNSPTAESISGANTNSYGLMIGAHTGARLLRADDTILHEIKGHGFGEAWYDLEGSAYQETARGFTKTDALKFPIFLDYIKAPAGTQKDYETFKQDANLVQKIAEKQNITEGSEQYSALTKAVSKLPGAITAFKNEAESAASTPETRTVYEQFRINLAYQAIREQDFKDGTFTNNSKIIIDISQEDLESTPSLVLIEDINLRWTKPVAGIDTLELRPYKNANTLRLEAEQQAGYLRMLPVTDKTPAGYTLDLHKNLTVNAFSLLNGNTLKVSSGGDLRLTPTTERTPPHFFEDITGPDFSITKDQLREAYTSSFGQCFAAEGTFNPEQRYSTRRDSTVEIVGATYNGNLVLSAGTTAYSSGATINGNVTAGGSIFIDPLNPVFDKSPEEIAYVPSNAHIKLLVNADTKTPRFGFSHSCYTSAPTLSTTRVNGDFTNNGTMVFVLREGGEALTDGYLNVSETFNAGRDHDLFVLVEKGIDASGAGQTHKLIQADNYVGAFKNEIGERIIGEYTVTLAKQQNRLVATLKNRTAHAPATPPGVIGVGAAPGARALAARRVAAAPRNMASFNIAPDINRLVNASLTKALEGNLTPLRMAKGFNVVTTQKNAITTTRVNYGSANFNAITTASFKDNQLNSYSLATAFGSGKVKGLAFGHFGKTSKTKAEKVNHLNLNANAFSAGVGLAAQFGSFSPYGFVVSQHVRLDGKNRIGNSSTLDTNIDSSFTTHGLMVGAKWQKKAGHFRFHAGTSYYKNLYSTGAVKGTLMGESIEEQVTVTDVFNIKSGLSYKYKAVSWGANVSATHTKDWSSRLNVNLKLAF